MVTPEQLLLIDIFLGETSPDSPMGCEPYFIGPETWEAFVALRNEVQQLREDNAAMLKQWNDLDQRTEKQHREWVSKMLELQKQNQKLKLAADAIIADPSEQTVNPVTGAVKPAHTDEIKSG